MPIILKENQSPKKIFFTSIPCKNLGYEAIEEAKKHYSGEELRRRKHEIGGRFAKSNISDVNLSTEEMMKELVNGRAELSKFFEDSK